LEQEAIQALQEPLEVFLDTELCMLVVEAHQEQTVVALLLAVAEALADKALAALAELVHK
jgi:hypothetical protein